ncbi:hypothetical protein KI387_026978, partial [Taxus chinensis]
SPLGRVGQKSANRPNRAKSAQTVRNAAGTNGTKVRGGREMAVRQREKNRLTAERDSLGRLGQKYPNRPVRPKSVQAVQNKVGQVEQKYPNRPVRPKWEQMVRKQMGRLDQKCANRPNRAKRVEAARKANGTHGTKRREPAGSAEISTKSTVPNGTKGRMGGENPKEPRTNQIMTCVTGGKVN